MADVSSEIKAMTQEQKIALGGFVAVAVSPFLPYMSSNGGDDLSLWKMFGSDMLDAAHWMFLLIGLAALGAYLVYSKSNEIAVLVGGAVLGMVVTIAIFFSMDMVGDASLTLGAFLSLLGGAAAAYGTLKTIQAK